MISYGAACGVTAGLVVRRLSSTGAVAAAATFSSSFDGGNGELVSCETRGDGVEVHVRIAKDPFTEGTDKKHHYQWFQFSVSGLTGKACSVVIDNAGDVSYPDAWGTHSDDGGTVCKFDAHWAYVERHGAEANANAWKRARDTVWNAETGTLSWTLSACDEDTVLFSFFPHYTEARHLSLVADSAARIEALIAAGTLRADSQVRSIATTARGREVQMISFAGASGGVDEDANVWIIARQHPGEPQAEWWVDGLLGALLEPEASQRSAAATALLASGVRFFVVPNMNPDGSHMGHLRTNSVGANLNREWAPTPAAEYDAPTEARSPEVLGVLRECDLPGHAPSLFLDVHADEELPFNFICGPEGCECFSDAPTGAPLRALHEFFGAAMRVHSGGALRGWNGAPHGYGLEAPREANMRVCSNQIAQRYSATTGCLGVTLEQPFKDVLQEGSDAVSAATSATPAKCRAFGRDSLGAILAAMELKRDLASSTGILAPDAAAWEEADAHLDAIRAAAAFATPGACEASAKALARLGDATRAAFRVRGSDPAAI